jgi:membrane associated rhomboid family serine protease
MVPASAIFFISALSHFVHPVSVSSPLLDVLIPARNRRQAMDWSLVLASQGIEHRIDQDETTGWTLAVAAADHAAALSHVNQYRLENRHWRWRRPIFQPGLFFDWSSLGWVLLILGFYGWSDRRADLRSLGMMNHAALTQGEGWRLFTATWLHADVAHLAMNAVFGFVFLGLVMARYGPGTGLLAAYLAGVGGNLAAGAIHGPDFHGLGSSGVVMGALGLVTFPSLILPKQTNVNVFRLVAAGLLAGVLIFVLIGVNPETDVVAHLGGFITGWLLGCLLARFNRLARHPRVNLAAGLLFAILVVIPWWFALAHR